MSDRHTVITRDASALPYRPDIDGLRAVAVLLVVTFHAFPALIPGGFVGVDVFFVISGYLITTIILKELGAGDFSLLNFYARRARRIIPALLIVLAATWALGWFVLLADELSNLGRHVIAGATFTSNLLLRLEVGYFDAAAESKPLLHLWSLGIEEQFYLLWPVMLAFWVRRGLRTAALVGGLLLLSFSVNVALVGHDPASAFYLLPSRFWELLLGYGLACLELPKGFLERLPRAAPAPLFSGVLSRNAASAVGVLLIVGSAFGIDTSDSFPGWIALLPTIGTVLLICAGPDTWLNRVVLANKAAVLIGLISYPLYLWHWPLISFAHIMEEGTPSALVRGCAVAAAVILAYATWRTIELPVQRRLFRAHPAPVRAKRYVLAGAIALVFAGSVGAVTIYQEGFDSRFGSLELVQRQMKWDSGGATRCRDKYDTDGICMATKPDPEIVLWGESHAEMLLPGLASTPSVEETSIILLGHYGCPPLIGVELLYKDVSQRCSLKNPRDRAIVADSLQDARVVILASRGPYYFTGKGFGIELEENHPPLVLAPADALHERPSPRSLFTEGYSNTITFLESLGKKVVLFVDVPELGFKPTDCVDVRPVRFSPKEIRTPCGVPLAVVKERQAEYREIIVELQRRHPGLAVFDPAPYLCDERTCYGALGGKVLYRDDDHLSAEGARYIARPFTAWLRDSVLSARVTPGSDSHSAPLAREVHSRTEPSGEVKPLSP